LFPDIRELPSMTGLPDLERQGYGFRAAKLCFKAHQRLLANAKVEKYLERNHVDIVRTLRSLVTDVRLSDTGQA
jgi:hypothetical protein